MKQYLIIQLIVAIAYSVEYDAALGEELFQYSRMAYCKAEQIQNWEGEPAVRHPLMQEVQVYTNNTHAAQGYCGYDPQYDRVVVAIRGSDDLKNWYQNLNFFFKDYNLDGCNNCKVHKGFHNVYENLVNNLLGCAYTLTTNHPTAKIVVTGHSLGAAIASFAAIEITHHVKNVDLFYIYGSPRIGNKHYVAYVESKLAHTNIIRVSHWKDAVLHLPTQGMGFNHFGHEAFMKSDDKNNYQLCYQDSKDCANRFFWPWQWSIKDHLFYYGQCSGCTQVGCNKYLAELEERNQE